MFCFCAIYALLGKNLDGKDMIVQENLHFPCLEWGRAKCFRKCFSLNKYIYMISDRLYFIHLSLGPHLAGVELSKSVWSVDESIM